MSLHSIASRRRERLEAAAAVADADVAYFRQVSREARAMSTAELAEERAPRRRADFSAGAPARPAVRFDSALFSPDVRATRDAVRLSLAPAGPAGTDEHQDDERRQEPTEAQHRQLAGIGRWLANQFRREPLDEDEQRPELSPAARLYTLGGEAGAAQRAAAADSAPTQRLEPVPTPRIPQLGPSALPPQWAPESSAPRTHEIVLRDPRPATLAERLAAVIEDASARFTLASGWIYNRTQDDYARITRRSNALGRAISTLTSAA